MCITPQLVKTCAWALFAVDAVLFFIRGSVSVAPLTLAWVTMFAAGDIMQSRQAEREAGTADRRERLERQARARIERARMDRAG